MTESSSLAPLQLKKNEERRIRAGHLWVYSNEVDTVATPLSGFEPGQQVQLLAHNGKRLGNGYVNPNSLICARLVSRDPRYLLDRSLLVAPADGRVMRVEPVGEDPFVGGPAVKVAIFLSVFNVHINRSPITGTVTLLRSPQMPIMKYIGSSTTSKKTKNRIRSRATKVPFMPVASTRMSAANTLGLCGSGQ